MNFKIRAMLPIIYVFSFILLCFRCLERQDDSYKHTIKTSYLFNVCQGCICHAECKKVQMNFLVAFISSFENASPNNIKIEYFFVFKIANMVFKQ